MMQVDRDFLLTPLKAAMGTVETRHTMPIFSSVLLETGDGRLAVTAIDHEMQVRAVTEQDGVADRPPVAVNARKLYDIVRHFPEDAAVTIEPNATRLRIACNGSKFNLQMHPAQDFPRLISAQDALEAVLPQRELRRLLAQTASAMAETDVRFWLNGTQIKLSEDSVEAVAQDSHRLAWASAKLEQASPPVAAIVPRKAAIELCKLLSDSGDAVRVRIGYGQISFGFDRIELIAKLIDWQQYPEHRIPAFTRRFTAERSKLQQALTRAAILAGKFRGVHWTADAGRLVIEVVNADHEDAQEVCGIGYEGEPIDVGVSIDYVLDALIAAGTEEIEFAVDAASRHVQITVPDRADFCYVIAMMRL